MTNGERKMEMKKPMTPEFRPHPPHHRVGPIGAFRPNRLALLRRRLGLAGVKEPQHGKN
jgi:hypothetical protein